MKIYNDINKIKKFKKTAIAIGNFDGIHLGHQKIIKKAYAEAKKNKLKFGIVTFEPLPVMFFNDKIKNHRINNKNQKINALRDLKIDFLIIIKFNKKFSKLNYKKFINNVIQKKLNSKFVYISKNFRFGNKRQGNVKKLIENEKLFFYKTRLLEPLKKNNKVLSSSIIRNEIRKGNIQKVNKFLGREWSVEGRVIKGEQRGRKIGFPTCNINLTDYVLPRLGVYSVKIHINKSKKKGIANVGFRPTFSGENLLLEVNIFGFKANLYNKKLTVKFVKFIRSEKKFKNIEQLKIQIKKDITKVRN